MGGCEKEGEAMKPLLWIGTLSIIGLALSGYLAYVHYVPETLDSSFCNLSDFVSCSTVNSSSYATFFGIPVAVFGVAGFLLLAFLSVGTIKYHRIWLFYLSLGALLFMFYLLIIELFVLKTICLYCIFTLVDVIALFAIAAVSWGRESVQFVKAIKVE